MPRFEAPASARQRGVNTDLLGFESLVTASAGLAAISLDTGGAFWFLLATWKDSSLWDA